VKTLWLTTLNLLLFFAAMPVAASETTRSPLQSAIEHLDRFEVQQARALFSDPSLEKNARASLVLGAFLLDNPTYENIEFEAYYLLKKARDLGDPSANLMLGHLYDRTERHPFHKQTFKSKLGAFKAYTAASKQKEPKAFWALSAAYFEGRIVERNVNQTRFYSEEAAKLGLPEAQYLTAILYSGVEGLDTNIALSEFWMCKAARAGFQDAVTLTRSEGLCSASSAATKPPAPKVATVKPATTVGSSGSSSSSSEDFFGLFMGAFFETLGEVAVYKLTGIDPPYAGGLSDEDLEEFRRIGRQEARRAARHQQRMQQIYKNIRSTSRIGY
jgi:TPR repeat protein